MGIINVHDMQQGNLICNNLYFSASRNIFFANTSEHNQEKGNNQEKSNLGSFKLGHNHLIFMFFTYRFVFQSIVLKELISLLAISFSQRSKTKPRKQKKKKDTIF